MRLAIIMNQKSPWGREIVSALIGLGAEVHVIDFESGNRTEYMASQNSMQADAITSFQNRLAGLHLLPSSQISGLRYLTNAPEVGRICERIEADILLTLYGGGSGLMAWSSGFRPYAVYTVGSDVLLANTPRRLISRVVFRNAALVLANGKYLAQRTNEISPRTRVEPLYIGVDTARFAFNASPASSRIHLVSTRGFIPVYNNEAIIRALAVMGPTAEKVATTFVSSGPTLGNARQLADDLLPPEVRGHVSFMGGADGPALLQVIRDSHIYVSMSRSDGTSTSLLEAFACGTFPVVSDIPANREWMDPVAENMLLVPLDDDNALASALARAANDAGLRAAAVAHNRKLVEQYADIHINMRRLLGLLDEARIRDSTRRVQDSPSKQPIAH